jgi:hypothetical protein
MQNPYNCTTPMGPVSAIGQRASDEDEDFLFIGSREPCAVIAGQ